MPAPTERIVIICGGRDYRFAARDREWLDALHRKAPITMVYHGACPTGADREADRWALTRGIEVRRFLADWQAHGAAAGPRRNAAMLDAGPVKAVIAFPGNRGTVNMMAQAANRGVEVIRPPWAARPAWLKKAEEKA